MSQNNRADGIEQAETDDQTAETPRFTRRGLLGIAGTAAALGVAGCTGSGSGDGDGGSDPADESGESSGGDGGGEDEEADDELTQEEVENRPSGEDVLEFQALTITEYEDSVEEREYGDDQFSVTGVVENSDDAAYNSVTVAVRGYNADGHQIDQYIDITQDLQAGGTWAFEVLALGVPAEDIADWDISVSGAQY